MSLRIKWRLVPSLVALGLTACSEPPAAPNPEALLASLNESEVTAADMAVGRQPLQIYIDSSQSMQGFLNVPHGRFRRALDQLLDRTVAGGYDVSVYKFDQNVAKLPVTTSTADLLSRSFFFGSETSFPSLFRHIRKERKPGTVAIVVTDLVQSSRTGEQRELSRAFQELAEGRPEVLLVAMRSPYSGNYWPQAKRINGQLRLDLHGQDVGSSRPFYLLIVADRVEDLEILRRHLQLVLEADAVSSFEVDVSRPAIEVQSATFEPSQDGVGADVWQIHRSPEELPSQGRTLRTALWLYEQETPLSSSGVPVRLRLQVEGELGVVSLSNVKVDAKRCSFKALGPCQQPESISIPFQIEMSALGDLMVSYSFPRPAPGTWDGYQVRLVPGKANLIRPINTELWTTDDDTEFRNATRTYKLSLFVDTLTNALREPVAFSEQIIFLGRGD